MNRPHDSIEKKQNRPESPVSAVAPLGEPELHHTSHPAAGARTEVSTEPAGLFRRIAAFGYDLLLLAALLFMFTLSLFPFTGGAIEPGTLWYRLSLSAIVVLFFTGFWVRGGQTLGMKAWRLRVVAEDGGPVRWPSALVRFFAGLVSLAAAGVGFWWAAFDRERRTWHDRLSRTRIVYERPGVQRNRA